MLQLKTKMGVRGQIVIPKIVRESLGFFEHTEIVLEVEDHALRLRPVSGKEILDSWKEIAQKEGVNVSREFMYGDKLYEEEFSK